MKRRYEVRTRYNVKLGCHPDAVALRDAEIEEAAGRKCYDAGIGAGGRDMIWPFEDGGEALEFWCKVEVAMPRLPWTLKAIEPDPIGAEE